jgi:predicted transcriptional regulator
MPGNGRRDAGTLEREILAVLGAADRPLTPAEVLAELGGSLAYTTVMTTLARLHAKGALAREPAGRTNVYRLAVAPGALDSALTARRMTRLLDAGSDRAAALTRFVADLRPEDEQLLLDLLASGPPTSGPPTSGPQDEA